MRAFFKDRIRENSTTYTFRFIPERKLDYIAGQFVELTVPHTLADKRGDKRWFTLSSSPTEQWLAITTKLDADSPSTYKRTLFDLNPNDPITVSEAMGDFVLPKDTSLPLVFIALGIGITPFRSMTRWLSDVSQTRSIRLLYGATTADALSFTDLFTNYGATCEYYIASKGSGRINAEAILAKTPATSGAMYYLAGPETSVEQLRHELIGQGLDQMRIVGDYFHNYL